MSKPLWLHQRDAIRAAEAVPDLGLLMEQGTGKTRTMIEILRRKYAKAGRIQRTLIFAPIIVCENWKQEFKLYSKVHQGDISVLTGPSKKRINEVIRQVGEDASQGKIFITNYEACQMTDLYKLLMVWQPEILICDESQRVKNHESMRARAVAAIADTTAHNFILTGTPILNSPMDIFMQFRILDRGKTFGKNFYSFRGQFFEDANVGFKGKQSYFPKWEARPLAYGELHDKIKRKALRVIKSECLDLPPFLRQEVSVSLSPEQARMYKEMHNEFVTFIDSKKGEPQAVVAQLAVTKAMKLQQIVSGFAKDENGEVHRIKDNPRIKVLSELLQDITPGSKVIVWSHFKENQRMITELCDSLKIEYREIHGDIPHSDREANMKAFRSNPNVRVMVANQAAGGVGINLVEASYMIYYSKGFKLEDDLQSEARAYRGGSEVHEKITRIDLVGTGTIDEHINEVLASKQNVSDTILSWSKNESKKK